MNKKSLSSGTNNIETCEQTFEFVDRSQEESDDGLVEGVLEDVPVWPQVWVRDGLYDNARAGYDQKRHSHEVDEVDGHHKFESVEKRSQRRTDRQVDGEQPVVEVEQTHREHDFHRVGREDVTVEDAAQRVYSEQTGDQCDLHALEDYGH